MSCGSVVERCHVDADRRLAELQQRLDRQLDETNKWILSTQKLQKDLRQVCVCSVKAALLWST